MTNAPIRSSRRDAICAAALDIAAADGPHALTHQAIDRHLGLPKGSTSYYYRTRSALVHGAAQHLTTRSRDDFAAVLSKQRSAATTDPAVTIARYLDRLLSDRARDVRARYALIVDGSVEPPAKKALAGSLFSVTAATELMAALGVASAEEAAADLLSHLEGLVFDHSVGVRADEPVRGRRARLQRSIERWLEAWARQQRERHIT